MSQNIIKGESRHACVCHCMHLQKGVYIYIYRHIYLIKAIKWNCINVCAINLRSSGSNNWQFKRWKWDSKKEEEGGRVAWVGREKRRIKTTTWSKEKWRVDPCKWISNKRIAHVYREMSTLTSLNLMKNELKWWTK